MYVPRDSLLNVSKPWVGLRFLRYFLYVKSSFVQKLESVNYKACLVITICIRSTFSEKLYSVVCVLNYIHPVHPVHPVILGLKYLYISLKICSKRYGYSVIHCQIIPR